jgi:hypothetical protein
MIHLHVRSGGSERERRRPTCPTDAFAVRKFPARAGWLHFCPCSSQPLHARPVDKAGGWRKIQSIAGSMKGKKMEWSLMTIVGPILFAVVLLWATTHNRRSRGEKQRTEEATRQRRAEEDADQKARER